MCKHCGGGKRTIAGSTTQSPCLCAGTRPPAQLADHPTNIRRVPVGATAEPLTLAGHIEQLAEIYRDIPSGRLVILGPAGDGKLCWPVAWPWIC